MLHDLRGYRARLAAIAALEPALQAEDDAGLAAAARALRERVGPGAPGRGELDLVFALAREAARRALGQRPFDEQLLAGLALCEGRVAEMATGEGKTLAAVAPVFAARARGPRRARADLQRLPGPARRALDGPRLRAAGLSVGVVQERMGPAERRAAYAADVTYVTANEAGFDHLRDGLCLEPEERVQRPFHFALVDEADSILIDEARVPLVIAGETGRVARRPGAPGGARARARARRATTTPTSTPTTSR